MLCLNVIIIFPLREDIEVCGAGFQAVALNAAHWCDALLCYSSHSERLRDYVAAVACWVCNTIKTCM